MMENNESSSETNQVPDTPIWVIKSSLVLLIGFLAGIALLGPTRLVLEWGPREYPAWDGQRMWFLLFGSLLGIGLIVYPVVKYLPRYRHSTRVEPQLFESTRWGNMADALMPLRIGVPVFLILMQFVSYSMEPADGIPQSWSELAVSLLITTLLVGVYVLVIFGSIAVLMRLHRRTLRRLGLVTDPKL